MVYITRIEGIPPPIPQIDTFNLIYFAVKKITDAKKESSRRKRVNPIMIYVVFFIVVGFNYNYTWMGEYHYYMNHLPVFLFSR